MEGTYSSETSAGFQRTTQRWFPEGKTLHDHRCENLKILQYILVFVLINNSDEDFTYVRIEFISDILIITYNWFSA
jgi:hypothetical protein